MHRNRANYMFHCSFITNYKFSNVTNYNVKIFEQITNCNIKFEVTINYKLHAELFNST